MCDNPFRSCLAVQTSPRSGRRTDRLLKRSGERGFGIVSYNLGNLREGRAGVAKLLSGDLHARRDIARNLVEAGNRRAREQGLSNLRFEEGDATDLAGLEDKTFDLVVSIFGAMFAPKPFDVAKEMVRVTRSGGRIVMGNWIPNDPTLVAQVLKVSADHTPPPPEGFISPMTWGIEANVVERFASTGVPRDNVSFLRDTYWFNFPGTPSELVDAFRRYYGPTMNAFEAAEKSGRAADLKKELDALFESQNTSVQKDITSIPATFLRVTIALD